MGEVEDGGDEGQADEEEEDRVCVEAGKAWEVSWGFSCTFEEEGESSKGAEGRRRGSIVQNMNFSSGVNM